MSLILVRSALETALAAMSPPLATGWENAPYTPVAGTPYQLAYLLPAEPDNLEMSGRLYWERGIFHINLFYPLGGGPAAAMARAELIRSTFYRGASFTSGGITVSVWRTPEIAPAMTDADRYQLPVRVRYYAQITRS